MKTKRLIIITSLVLVFVAAALTWTVYAILHGASNTATNTLTPDTDNTPTINETFRDGVKDDVNFTNTADYSVYVRAAIVVTWQNAEGEVHSIRPVRNTDYVLTINATKWISDTNTDLYYYNEPLAKGKTTINLIDDCMQIAGTAPAGYKLHVELVCQTVQAKGTTDNGNTPAVVDAWGVTLSGTTITAVPSSGN